MDTRILHCAQNGDRLASELGDGNGDVGVLDILLEAVAEPALEFDGRKSGGLNAANQWQMDVAAQVDAQGLGGNLFDVSGLQSDLVIWPEHIALLPKRGSGDA